MVGVFLSPLFLLFVPLALRFAILFFSSHLGSSDRVSNVREIWASPASGVSMLSLFQ